MTRRLPDRLQTERLQFREPRESDARLIFETYTQDSEVARYTVWRPHTSLRQTEVFIAECVQGWASGFPQAYVLALQANMSQPIGMIEARTHDHIVDIGYVLARRWWGKGLMSEAIRALTRVALERPEVFRVQATCDVDNIGSAKALEKAGFAREARLERYTVHPNIASTPRPCYLYARCK